MLEDCPDQTNLLGDAEPRLKIFHMDVVCSFSLPLVTGPSLAKWTTIRGGKLSFLPNFAQKILEEKSLKFDLKIQLW